MLNNYQKCLIRAYGKAQMTLKSHAVMLDKNYKGNREESEWGYIVDSCEEAIHRNQKVYEVVQWMHPHILPCWDEFDILEDDFSEYMHRRFPLLFNSPV
ncbi:MAG: hypothetical protein K0R34_2810 [Herbinix sp.]|jgi:hypothetical protein|nr:hypothetical protein [Herbinix sp.]